MLFRRIQMVRVTRHALFLGFESQHEWYGVWMASSGISCYSVAWHITLQYGWHNMAMDTACITRHGMATDTTCSVISTLLHLGHHQ